MNPASHPFTEENNIKFKTIIKNLGTIRKVMISDKLYTDNDLIYIHHPRTLLGIIRWWYKYNRVDSAKFLIEMFDSIDSLLSILTFIIDNQKPKKKQKRRQKRYKSIIKKKTLLINSIHNSKKGLENLILTYSDDEDFCNSINTILEKYNQYSEEKIKTQ